MDRSKPLAERERAFEEVFFRKENERLIAAMRARKSRQDQFDALSATLGVDSPDLIEAFLDLGIREENVTALVLAPMVSVAWADHAIEASERRSILKAEHDFGITPDSDAGKLLDHWLEHRPHESLLEAWAAYVHELCRVMPPESRERLKQETLSRANAIARTFEKSLLRASGPSEAEKAVLAKVESAFLSV